MPTCSNCGAILIPIHPSSLHPNERYLDTNSKWEGNWFRTEYKNGVFLCKNCTTRRVPLTFSEKVSIIEAYRNRCAKCKKKLLPEYLGLVLFVEVKRHLGDYVQFDHIVEKKIEGTNDLENQQPLCIECHLEKTMKFNQLMLDKERENRMKEEYGF